MSLTPLPSAGRSLGKAPLKGSGVHPWLPPACPGTGRTQQCPRQRRGTGKGDNGVIESPSVPGRQRLAPGTGCLARTAWEPRNAGLRLRTGWDSVEQRLGGQGC